MVVLEKDSATWAFFEVVPPEPIVINGVVRGPYKYAVG